MNEDEMRMLSDYFDLVIFDRFMRYFDARKKTSLLESSIYLEQDASPFGGFFSVLDAVGKTFDLTLKMFSSASKTDIVNQFTKGGFRNYDNDVNIQYYLGVLPANIDRLKAMITRNLQIPPNKQASYNDFIEFSDLADSSSWNNFHNFLKTDNTGGAKSIQLFFNFDEVKGKHNVFVTNVATKFKIADDLFIQKSSKSTFGGLFYKEKIEFKYVPHVLTIEET